MEARTGHSCTSGSAAGAAQASAASSCLPPRDADFLRASAGGGGRSGAEAKGGVLRRKHDRTPWGAAPCNPMQKNREGPLRNTEAAVSALAPEQGTLRGFPLSDTLYHFFSQPIRPINLARAGADGSEPRRQVHLHSVILSARSQQSPVWLTGGNTLYVTLHRVGTIPHSGLRNQIT